MDDIAASHRVAIGGSMIAALMGVSPWETPYSLWSQIMGLAPEKEYTPEMARGHRFESYVLEDIARRTGHPVYEVEPIFTDEYGFPLIAHIDGGLTDEEGEQVAEAKTTRWTNAALWQKPECPVHVEAQVQWYMLAKKGSTRAYVACRWGLDDDDTAFFIVRRNETVIASMLREADRFWNEYVVTKTPPPITGKAADTDTLRAVLAESRPESIILPSDLLPSFVSLTTLKEEMARLEEKAALEENRIKLAMGEAEAAECGPWKVSWKTQKARTYVDSAKLKAELPDLYAKYTKTGSAPRPFIVKEA